MSAYSRASRPDEVVRLFNSLPFPPTAPLFTTLISSLAASGRHSAAREAFYKLFGSGLRLTASNFIALLKSHSAASVDSVYCLFKIMVVVGCTPDAAAYNCLIWALCDSQRVEEALGVLDSMLDSGIYPTVHSYTAIQHGYCKQGRVLEAERMGLLDEAFWQAEIMESRGVSMTAETVNILFDCLCREPETRGFHMHCPCWNAAKNFAGMLMCSAITH
ncbi:unnamed protein product [Urochloa humidicola]